MTTPLSPDLGHWCSGQPTLSVATADLKPGQIVIADRRPLRILTIHELRWGQWSRRFVEAWQALGTSDSDPNAWPNRPFEFECRWEDVNDTTRIEVADASASFVWDVLPAHYVVCRLCGDLPPCRHVHVWHSETGYDVSGKEES